MSLSILGLPCPRLPLPSYFMAAPGKVKASKQTENQSHFVEVATMGELGLASRRPGETRSLEVVLESGDGRSVRVRDELDASSLMGLAQVALGVIWAGGIQR